MSGRSQSIPTRTGKDGLNYIYRFGNYLKQAEHIEDAATVEKVYYVKDGLGRRRLRQVASVSGGVETVTDNKLYRWAGLEEIGEYEAGTTNWWVWARRRAANPVLVILER